MNLKHVGRIIANQRKVVVAYRTIPGDSDHCLVVPTENLSSEEHDALIRCVEGSAGQEAYEFAEAMARWILPDGRNMLAWFHKSGKLVKVPTTAVEMIPDTKTKLPLNELNKIIADQKGVSVDDLALQGTEQPTKPQNTPSDVQVEDIGTINDISPTIVGDTLEAGMDEVLTDEALAAKLRSDADRLFKEAKALREQAEDLVPTKKKVTKQESA